MQSKRDQVHAHRFVMSRLSSAVLQGEPDAPSSPMRRFTIGTFAGAMIAVVLVAGSALIGLMFHGGSSAFTQPGAIIVEKETGSRYLLLGGTLRPVLNNASARLLTGSEGHIVSTSTKSLRDLPHGAPIGIPGAPDNLPDPAHLTGTDWLVCSPQQADSAGTLRTGLAVLLGAQPPVTPLGRDQGALVRTPAGKTYLVWRNRRFLVPMQATLVSLGYGSVRPFPVAAQWVNSLTAGPDLVAPVIDNRGKPGRVLEGVQRRLGQVFVVHTAGNDDTFFVLTGSGLAPVTSMLADLLLGDPRNTSVAYPGGGAQAITVSATVAVAAQTSSVPAAADLPLAAPQPVDGASGQVPCTQLRFGSNQGPATRVAFVNPGRLPQAPTSGTPATGTDQDPVQVNVAPGGGMLALELAAPGVTSGTRYLVTDLGVRYPLPSSDVADLLGYGGVAPTPVPSTILALLPTGQPLDPAAAAVTRPVQAPLAPTG
jgi:type VII secretion protein EccB